MTGSAPDTGAPPTRRRHYPAAAGQPPADQPVEAGLDLTHAESAAHLAEAAAHTEEQALAVEAAGLAHYRANAEHIAANLAADPDVTGMGERDAEPVREFLQAFPDEQDQAKIVSAWRDTLADLEEDADGPQPHQNGHACTSRQEPA